MIREDLRGCLQQATAFLRVRGCLTARLDAEVLFAHVMGCSRAALYARHADRPDPACQARVRELIRLRASGAPLAHLTGEREFFGHAFLAGPAALVPRPDTEQLVELTIEHIARGGSDYPGVDLGTGSGAIAIAIAMACPSSRVIGIDLSERAIRLAARNVARYGLQARVSLSVGRGLSSVVGPIGWMVSNPPYLDPGSWSHLMTDVAWFDPPMALYSAEEGLEMLRAVCASAGKLLVPGGLLAVECATVQVPAVLEFARPLGEPRTYYGVCGAARGIWVRRTAT